jgi:hypothetical protein
MRGKFRPEKPGLYVSPLPPLIPDEDDPMEYRLKCTNGHDRCYMGTDDDCPYCERVPAGPVNIDDDLHRVLREALEATRRDEQSPQPEAKP